MNNYNVEIYEVPSNWVYTKPDGKIGVRQTVSCAVSTGDPMRFLYCLHHEYRQKLDQNSFFRLFNMLRNMDEKKRDRYLDENLRYRDVEGNFKVYFENI